jgi:TPR repeat protein
MQAQLQEAYQALLNRDYAKALTLYAALSEANEPTSFYYMGYLYFGGLGVERDLKRAHELYMQSAMREVPLAQFEVAMTLENGDCCTQNYSEAAFWYEEAAKRGNIEAYNNLGALYREGLGVEQDYRKAFILFKKAADAGNPQAQFNLGALYDMGLGCEEDKEKALEYCRKAAFSGHQKAKDIMQRMQQDGQIVF